MYDSTNASGVDPVFTIPASAPFLPTLINALRDDTLVLGFPAGGDPLALAKRRFICRRGARLPARARRVFLDHLDGDAAILPRIVALGDLDEDEIIFAEAATGDLLIRQLNLSPTFGAGAAADVAEIGLDLGDGDHA